MKKLVLLIMLTIGAFATTKVVEVNKDYGFIVLCINGYQYLWTYGKDSTQLVQMYETTPVVRSAIPATCN